MYTGWKRVENGAEEGERQEADRAEEIPGKRGRVEVEKGGTDRELKGGRREKRREATTKEDEEGGKEGKEAERKLQGSRGERERRR